MFGLGFAEILVILVVVLLVFGPERMPEIARTLGRASWQLRKAANEFRSEMEGPLQLEREMKQELRELTRLAQAESRAFDKEQRVETLPVSDEQQGEQNERAAADEKESSEENAGRAGSSEMEKISE